MPDISMSGKDIIREKRTAIPSLFAISPMISPSAVLIIPMKSMRWIIAVGSIAYFAP